MARNGRPERYASGIARRATIVEAALSAFTTVGYWNASMNQIAADCGVTRAGLLHHFPTKEALLEAVLERRDEVNRARFWPDATAPQDDGREYLVRLIRLLQHHSSAPGLVSLFSVLAAEAISPDHPAHGYFESRYETVRGWIRDALRQLQSSGSLVPDADPEGLEVELVALMDGLQVQWLYRRDRIDIVGHIAGRLNLILREPITADEILGTPVG